MILEWDEAKNRANVRKHGFDFAEEERWIGIGMMQGRVAFVVFAAPSNDVIRIISLRKANHEERQEYEKAIQNGLEAN